MKDTKVSLISNTTTASIFLQYYCETDDEWKDALFNPWSESQAYAELAKYSYKSPHTKWRIVKKTVLIAVIHQ